MSLSKSKSLLTGVLLAILLAMTSSAAALDDMRLWKPYQPESFGGNRRDADGFYASVEGLLWKVANPKNIPIGYRNPDGTSATRTVFDGNTVYQQSNSLHTSQLSDKFTLGTRLEVGNIQGHHGWLFSGYGVSGGGGSFTTGNYRSPFDSSSGGNNNNSGGSGSNNNTSSSGDIGIGNFSTMVIRDSLTLSAKPYFDNNIVWNKIWQPNIGTFLQYDFPISFMNEYAPVGGIGYLWGWMPLTASNPAEIGLYLVPLPINFRYVNVANRANLINLELLYTYRAHPFKWGQMELLAGARYWDMDDKMTFTGLSYTDKSVNINTGGGSNNSGSSGNSGYSLSEQMEMEELYLSNIRTSIVGQIRNRVIGPEIGMKISRRNARWTFGAEARFLAGVNAQSQTVSGTLTPQYFASPGSTDSGSSGTAGSGGTGSAGSGLLVNDAIPPYQMIGIYNNQRSFYHHRTQTCFSPGVDLRFTAKWQWTDNVGIQLGFNSTIVDNVGRGADIIDYRIQDNGQLFGFRNNSRTTVLAYGVNLGLSARR